MDAAKSMPQARNRFFYLLLPLAVLATTLLHEAGHWLMGTALGHPMRMSLNEAGPVPGYTLPGNDLLLIAAAGPLVTVMQAVIAWVLIRGRNSAMAYAFLFSAWFMRFAAAFVSLSHPNDEARISLVLLGGQWWLPGIVVAGLSALLWSAARWLGISWKKNLFCYLICSLTTAVIVFGDRMLL